MSVNVKSQTAAATSPIGRLEKTMSELSLTRVNLLDRKGNTGTRGEAPAAIT